MRQPIPPAGRHLAAEAVIAVTRQGALDLDDVLVRRLRITPESADGGRAAAAAVAPLIAPYLGWDAAQVQQAVSVYDDHHPSSHA